MTNDTQDNLLAAALSAVAQPPTAPTARNESAPQETPVKASSPTLTGLDASRRPAAETVCETCPHSVWFSSPREVQCYCRVMYLVTWRSTEPQQISACDGPSLM